KCDPLPFEFIVVNVGYIGLLVELVEPLGKKVRVQAKQGWVKVISGFRESFWKLGQLKNQGLFDGIRQQAERLWLGYPPELPENSGTPRVSVVDESSAVRLKVQDFVPNKVRGLYGLYREDRISNGCNRGSICHSLPDLIG